MLEVMKRDEEILVLANKEQQRHWYITFSYWRALCLAAVGDRIIAPFFVFNKKKSLKCNEYPENMFLYFTFGYFLSIELLALSFLKARGIKKFSVKRRYHLRTVVLHLGPCPVSFLTADLD
jgi:hypothetical protein